MHADDAVLLFSNKNEVEIEKAINYESELLRNWLFKNGLILNPSKGKTEFMLIGTAVIRRKTTHQVKINIGSKNINNIDSYKFHGVHLHMSLYLSDPIVKICKQASGRLGLLRRIRRIRTTYANMEIYKAMVHPVLTYCGNAFI